MMTVIKEPIWKTKDGQKIPISKMSTSHIKNTIKMLERNGFIARSKWDFYLCCSGPTGEYAQMALEKEQDAILIKHPLIILDDLERELEHREE